jgi:regulator of protease activity HflC (stomatin/prohibitin superfamily)
VIIGIVIAAALIVVVLVARSVKIIREYQRIVLFRLGRAIGIRGPGFVVINPATDRTTLVDLREQYLEIPHQTAITKDNAPISIDFIIFYKVVDPSMSVLTVQNFAGAALNLAATTLRSVVGDMPLDDVLSKREEMNASLRVRLDDVTERWGVKVTSVEVREVNPPPGVLEAMTRQMSAERTRRAQVTEAEGQKSAAILAAEGEAQAAINIAEGRQKATILAAEADRQSAILRAEGYARGLEKILVVGATLDQKTMVLQYLDTLKQVGTSASTKIVVPMEILDGLRNLIPGVELPPVGTKRAASGESR